MDFSSIFFGKKLEDLSYADIVSFFSVDQDETDMIEFKSFNAAHGNIETNLEGIKKGITAMLNSNGGIVIWGAPEGHEVAGRKEKVFGGALSPVIQLIEKDRLINKISSSIIPLPVGVNVKILNDGANYIYIFEIQKSPYSPHQFKNLYYARLDGQSQPAPHYLIEALFRKISYPDIRGFIKLDKAFVDNSNYILDISIIMFNFSELQNEEDVSYRVVCDNGIFLNSCNPELAHAYGMDGHQFIYKGLLNVLHYGSPDIHNERIVINAMSLSTRYNSILELFLYFGGKKSPLKFTEYKLDFRRLDLNKSENPQYLIVEKKENVLAAEENRLLGQSPEDQVTLIMNS